MKTRGQEIGIKGLFQEYLLISCPLVVDRDGGWRYSRDGNRRIGEQGTFS